MNFYANLAHTDEYRRGEEREPRFIIRTEPYGYSIEFASDDPDNRYVPADLRSRLERIVDRIKMGF